MKAIKLSRIAKHGIKSILVEQRNDDEYIALVKSADERIKLEKERLKRAYIKCCGQYYG